MNANEFLKWLGIELQHVIQVPIDLNRFEVAQDLVNRAINELMKINSPDQSQIRNEISNVSKTQKIGDFHIPFDIRDDCDIIEAILATILGILK